MLTNNTAVTAHQMLEEFHLLLRDCCLDHPAPRTMAVRYQICRLALMRGELHSGLPGFVRQCGSLLKFREFIHLYDHEPANRAEFIEVSLHPCWAQVGLAPPTRCEADGGVVSPFHAANTRAVSNEMPVLRSAEHDVNDFMSDEEEDGSAFWGSRD